MTIYRRCPNCSGTPEPGFSGSAFLSIYECHECGKLYCQQCGGKSCPECGSHKRKEIGKCHSG